MQAMSGRPIVVHPHGSVSHCVNCGARSVSVCNTIPSGDIERLASAAVQMTAPPGTTIVAEGDPATHFFNISSGTARMVKLLPDGRRQITGFASVGHFLGLAVSDSYSFSAEAIDTVHY